MLAEQLAERPGPGQGTPGAPSEHAWQPPPSAADDREPAANSRAGRGEVHVEALALGLDLGAKVPGHCSVDESPVAGEQRGGGLVAVRVDTAGVAAQVRAPVRAGRQRHSSTVRMAMQGASVHAALLSAR